MKKFARIFLSTLTLALTLSSVQSQVVLREYLSQNHSGTVENSLNFPGKPLNYEWQYGSMEINHYFAEGEAIQKIHYTLVLKAGDREVLRLPVLMRDLIVTYYVEIGFDKEDARRTVSAIFQKSNKWVKLKGVLHEGCRRPDQRWGRLNDLRAYAPLLQYIVAELDRNIDFHCYIEAP